MTLQRKSELKRKQPRRDWSEARAKVTAERCCRVGVVSDENLTWTNPGCWGPVEAAHIIGREHDKKPSLLTIHAEMGLKRYIVAPDRIVPLCTAHHRAYDAHELDLLPFLSPEEQAQAVLDAGSLELARQRLAPSCYRPTEEAA